jgi:hypothetical protein
MSYEDFQGVIRLFVLAELAERQVVAERKIGLPDFTLKITEIDPEYAYVEFSIQGKTVQATFDLDQKPKALGKEVAKMVAKVLE